MKINSRAKIYQPLVWIVSALFAIPVFAAQDLTGQWQVMYHEDQLERGQGPNIGDYLGIPVNDDGRLHADSWAASLLTLPEWQCVPHPAVYAMRGPGNIDIYNDIDPLTHNVRAIIIWGTFGQATRTIWMDGRPHPPEYAAHTWAGFSTGKWDGDILTVETTHVKAAYIRRNGMLTTDQVTMTEHFYRHGDLLTDLNIRYEPAYLTEPFVQSEDWVLNPNQNVPRNKCEPVEEIANRPRGYVPHHLPGTNPDLREFADRFGVPYEATRGGAETMYPEYRKKLKVMRDQQPAQKK